MNAITSLLCALPALLPLSATETPQDQAKPVTVSTLKEEIDASLRWLRARQAADTGAYGNLASTTAVLMAFGDSHRRYREGDGPFVDRAVAWVVAQQREDGAFVDGDVPEGEEKAQTLATFLALELIGGEASAKARTRAAVLLGIEPGEGARATSKLTDLGNDVLLDRAASELARRHPLGYWEEDGERVHTTAGTIWRLGAIHRELSSRSPSKVPGTETPLPAFGPADRERTIRALVRGAEFLVSASERGRWGFEGHPDPGITAMAVAGLLAVPEPRPEHVQAAIDDALDWLVSLQKEDGAIHAGQLHNYVTCASVMALVAGRRAKDEPVVTRARAYLRALQADEGEGYTPADRYYGGVGYGGDERPDLSNLQMALEALATGDEEENQETFAKALRFLQRCQNRSESNELVIVRDGTTTKSGEDGGAGYAPGESKAGFVELRDGTKVPRSYGSMTYALLKGYLFAGLPRDDPRVEAAWKWLTKHYTLDVNPGFEASSEPTAAYQGLYYYFHTMARALDLYGEETIVDARGTTHPWRAELAGRLVSMQRPDSSWINVNSPRWYEGNPVLATAYALATLDVALPAEDR